MKERAKPNPEIGPEFFIKVFSSTEFSRRVKEVLDLTNQALISSQRKQGKLEIPSLAFV